MTQDEASAYEPRRPSHSTLGGEWKNVDGRDRRERDRAETRGVFVRPRRFLAPEGLERKPA